MNAIHLFAFQQLPDGIAYNNLESNISRIKEHLTDDEILSAKMEL